MKIYCIQPNDHSPYEITGEKKPNYVQVDSYGPIKSMPFLDGLEVGNQMRQFWDVNMMLPGLHIAKHGKAWPDVVGCSFPPPNFFLSQAIIESLEFHGIPVWRKTEFPIAVNKNKNLQNIPSPKYFVVEAEPGIEIDYNASGIAIDPLGTPIFTREQVLHRPLLLLDLKSWTGANLFTYFNWGGGSRLTLLCTEKIVEIAKKEEWRNIAFERQPIK